MKRTKVELHRVQFNPAERCWVIITMYGGIICRAPKSLSKLPAIRRAAKKLGVELSDLHVIHYKGISSPSEFAMHRADLRRKLLGQSEAQGDDQ